MKASSQSIIERNAGIAMLQKMYVVDATPPNSDEKIPDHVESKFKKRRWFGNVLFSFDFLLPFISDKQLKEEIITARKMWTDPKFTRRSRPTYIEDIEHADKLIRKVLDYFEKGI